MSELTVRAQGWVAKHRENAYYGGDPSEALIEELVAEVSRLTTALETAKSLKDDATWTMWASYVIGGWKQIGVGGFELLRVVAQGLETSPVAEVFVMLGHQEGLPPVEREFVKLQERAEKAEAECVALRRSQEQKS